VADNKRITTALFLWFVEQNAVPWRSDFTRCIADNALVAVTLLITVSEPVEKGVIINRATLLTVKEWLQCEGAATSVLVPRIIERGMWQQSIPATHLFASMAWPTPAFALRLTHHRPRSRRM
jgi:hypothetical protein